MLDGCTFSPRLEAREAKEAREAGSEEEDAGRSIFSPEAPMTRCRVLKWLTTPITQ